MKINISNLSEGLHVFDYKAKSDAFGLTEEDENWSIFPNDIEVKVWLNKVGESLFLKIRVCTVAHFVCDRCLKSFSRETSDEFRLLYSTGKNFDETDGGEIRTLGLNTTEIDISADVREALLLSIPLKILCSEQCCGLCPGCGADLNHEPCRCTPTDVDPRWEVLKRLVS